MAENRNNWLIGSVKVLVDGVSIGYTDESTEIEFTEEVAPITVDGYGSSLISEAIVGRGITIKAKLKQVTKEELENVWANVLQFGAGSSATHVDFDHATNDDYYTDAKEVILRRRKAGADTTEDFYVFKAGIRSDGPISLNNNDMWMLPITITAYVNDDGILGGFGDSDGA